MPTYERITCDDVRVGDRVAHARTHRFWEITEIREGPKARTLLGPFHGRQPGNTVIWRPRRTTPLWREI